MTETRVCRDGNTSFLSETGMFPSTETRHFVLWISYTTKKTNVRASNDKFVTVRADRDLFGRLQIASNARQIDLKEVLSYELSTVPFALANQDGSLRKKKENENHVESTKIGFLDKKYMFYSFWSRDRSRDLVN